MHHSPRTWPQESFTGNSGISSSGNLECISEAGPGLFSPLCLPYSSLHMEQRRSSAPSVPISTRGEVCMKSSTWLGVNWIPFSSSSSSSSASSELSLDTMNSVADSRSSLSSNNRMFASIAPRVASFMLTRISSSSTEYGRNGTSPCPLASRSEVWIVYCGLCIPPASATRRTILNQALSTSVGGPPSTKLSKLLTGIFELARGCLFRDVCGLYGGLV